MTTVQETNRRIQGLFGSGFTAWILITIALIAPEWSRDADGKHCGVIFCCMETYGNCTITDESVVGDKFGWMFASWLASFVAICSSTCRCSRVKKENVRMMAALLVIAGIFSLTASIEFFIKKFTVKQLDFSAGGFVAHAAGWMFFISGCCGYCHGYEYSDDSLDSNQVYPMGDPGGFFGVDRFSRFAPMSFARKKWRDIQSTRTPGGITNA